LFSPGCASFDMFSDFRQRGEIYKRCVHQLQC
jgi:UDP-N-acetylmuramoylalanine-D-glutamate ligase